MFTKEICEKVIFFEPGSEPVRSTDQCFDSYPCVFNTLSFELSATDLLVSLADVISGAEDSLYSFYITINDYCRSPKIAGVPFRELDIEALDKLSIKLRVILKKKEDQLRS